MVVHGAYERAPRVAPDQAAHVSDRVILIRRVAKVTAGGKHLRFNALVAVGDGQGHVGLGLGKAEAVPEAVRKATAVARRNVIRVPLKGTTIPHAVVTKYRASKVLLRPAVPGTGVLAGATVRAVVELAGIKDLLSKALGNTNPINLAKATMDALATLRDPEQAPRRRPAVKAAMPAPPTTAPPAQAAASTPPPAPAPPQRSA